MKKYKLVIFDMDGTILDTLEDLCDSVNASLMKHDFPPRTIDEVRMFVGNGIRKLIERAVPQGTDTETTDRVHETFLSYYKDHCAVKTKPYDKIPELIRALRERNILTAVNSNKAHFAVGALCRDYFDGLFDAYVGDREGMEKKPAPDGVEWILQKLGVTKEETIYVGDSDVDMATALNAGVDRIGCDWGFRGEAFLLACGVAPEQIAKKPMDILAMIEGK